MRALKEVLKWGRADLTSRVRRKQIKVIAR
jgi:hypothetical protein